MHSQVHQLIGVYHAEGGLTGELRYVVGKLLGTTHCSLCDITHSPVRRKREWDAMVLRRGVPFSLLHLNELPEDVARVVGTAGSPIVLARAANGALQVVLGPAELDSLDGSVAAFERSLDMSLERRAADG